MKTSHSHWACLGVACLLAAIAGCKTTNSGIDTEPRRPEALLRAEQMFEARRYADALIACVDLQRDDPLMPGLAELQARIMTQMNDERAEVIATRGTDSGDRMILDVNERHVLPDTYGIRRQITGDTNTLSALPSSMQTALMKPVDVHLASVGLEEFILAIGASEDINIIADDMQSASTLTIHADDVPLGEILDYVARNLGISFYVGNNIIWATPSAEASSPIPFETRIYRLRKGLAMEEIDGGPDTISIIQAIERFVPQPAGADMMFDFKSHVLIVRNTRENLSGTEKIIKSMDITPPQVLIESRFMATRVSDFRELGIEWMLNSPWVVSTKRVDDGNGNSVYATETQVDENGSLKFGFDAETAQQGLNFTYRGVLTDPMFEAVLHALVQNGDARNLSAPKVTTVNNRPARLRIGEDFLYYEEYDLQRNDRVVSQGNISSTQGRDTLVPVGSPTKEELGYSLEVTPSVGADMSSITLKVFPKIVEFVDWSDASRAGEGIGTAEGTNEVITARTIQLPLFRRSEVETEVIVQSGETVVMGGLVSSTKVNRQEGVPFFSSIPLLGQLFRYDTIDEDRQNLLIFVTATIISEQGESLVPITN